MNLEDYCAKLKEHLNRAVESHLFKDKIKTHHGHVIALVHRENEGQVGRSCNCAPASLGGYVQMPREGRFRIFCSIQ